MPRLSPSIPVTILAALLALANLPALAQTSGTEGTREVQAAKAKLPPDAAKVLFGSQPIPAPLEARSIGAYARGCLAGAIALPVDGPAWQVMRLSRNRNWGHPNLVAFLERFATAAQKEGWPGLLVGDMSQPRGGPMLTGHASHQIGLDADIWLLPMPSRELTPGERETVSAVSVVKPDKIEIDPKIWTPLHQRLIRRAALDPEVARIFVNPAIKKALCDGAGTDRDWLSKVRPWYGHNYHFHVRLACPPGMADCRAQEPPPTGDGCGKDLAWWLGPEPYKPEPPSPPKPPLKLADLPPACSQVLLAH
ncbi:MAG: penicillin-insensitive murein endopeptidase [Ancalomicrobiaceae bacterium]|nr:penicillin-insensitive murein endopeptidase [Ancalomicrobiaceae bacterium]